MALPWKISPDRGLQTAPALSAPTLNTPLQNYSRLLDESLASKPDVMWLLDGHHSSGRVQSTLFSKTTIDRLAAAGYKHIGMEFPPSSARAVRAYLDKKIAYQNGQIDQSAFIKSRAEFVKQMTSESYPDPDVVRSATAGLRPPNDQEALMLGAAAGLYKNPSRAAGVYQSLGSADKSFIPSVKAGLRYLQNIPSGRRDKLIADLMRESYRKAENFANFYDYAKEKGMQFIVGDDRHANPNVSHYDDRHFLRTVNALRDSAGGPNKLAFIGGAGHMYNKSPLGLDALMTKQGLSFKTLGVLHDEAAVRNQILDRVGVRNGSRDRDGRVFEYNGVDVPDRVVEMTGGRTFAKSGDTLASTTLMAMPASAPAPSKAGAQRKPDEEKATPWYKTKQQSAAPAAAA